MIGRICFCLLALSVAVIGRAASGDEAEVLSTLKSGVDEVFGIVYGPNETGELLSVRLRPVLEKHFDFAGITRRAVGPRWREFSSEQKSAVLSLFSDVVLRTYIDSFEPGEKPGIKYGSPVRLSDTRWEMPTTIEYAGSEYSVAYRMSKGKSGWQVYDVIIEGVSMISNYRGQFDAIMQKGGVKSLIDSLNENLRAVSKPK
jgi:phospholipid transport system substrate-binding protein